jgi:hypothetical protein
MTTGRIGSIEATARSNIVIPDSPRPLDRYAALECEAPVAVPVAEDPDLLAVEEPDEPLRYDVSLTFGFVWCGLPGEGHKGE